METAEEVQAKGKIRVLQYFAHHTKTYWGFETVNSHKLIQHSNRKNIITIFVSISEFKLK